METRIDQLSVADLQQQREAIRRGLLRTNTAAVIILLVVIGLALAAVIEAGRAVQERTRAIQAEQNAREKLWRSYADAARARRASPQAGHRVESLEALKNAARMRPSLELRNEAISGLALADVRFQKALPHMPASAVTLNDLVDRYAMAGATGRIQIRRCQDNDLLAELPALAGKVTFIHPFSPNGQFLPVAYDDGNICLWDLNSKEVIAKFRLFRPGDTVDFSPDSRWLAVAEAGEGVLLCDLSRPGKSWEVVPNTSWHGARFSSDGTLLGIFSEESTEVLIAEAQTGSIIRRLRHPAVVRALAWYPDKQWLATGCHDQNAYLWDLAQPGRPLRVFSGHQSAVTDVAIHPGGELLASSSWDGTTRLWDTVTGQELARLNPGGLRLRFSRSGGELSFYSGVDVSSITINEVTAHRALGFLRESEPEAGSADPRYGESSAIWEANFSRDERLMTTAGKHGVRVWDLPRRTELARLTTNESFTAFFHPDGKHLVASGHEGLKSWRIEQNGDKIFFSPPENLAPHIDCDRAAISENGKALVYGHAGRVYLIGREQSWEGWPGALFTAVSADGQWVAASGWGLAGVRLWETRGGKLVREFPACSGLADIAFSPDNRWLLTGGKGEYCFWDLSTCEAVHRLPRSDTVNFHGLVAFSPDRKLVAVTRSLTQVQLLEAETLEEVARLESPVPQLISWLTFSPSGKQLAVATETPFIQIWDLRWLRQQLAELGLDWSSGDVERESVQRGSVAALPMLHAQPLPRSTLLTSWANTFFVLTVAGVLLAICLAVFVLRRNQKLVVGYQRLDELAMQRTRDLEAAQNELLHGQKMRALGTLAAGIAHDFNNLLSVVRLSNDVIGQETRKLPGVQEEVQSIEHAVQQGRAVVRSMLGYSRQTPEQPDAFAVEDVVAETVSLLSKEFLSDILLTLDVEPQIPKVHGVRSRLEQALLNLIVNASEAMQRRGKLRISVRTRTLLPDEKLALRPAESAQYVELSVADFGPGIAPEVLPRIFEPFFTTKIVGSARGTGLGLSLVYTIAQQDGFGLAVETALGEGTIFRILLPVMRNELIGVS